MHETLTWNDVLNKLKQLTPEQLEMPACILDMNNDDRDNILIADPHGYFLENTPALFFHSGYGHEFDRELYYKEEYKDEYDEDEYVWEDVTLIVRNKELTLSQEQYWDKSVGQLFEEIVYIFPNMMLAPKCLLLIIIGWMLPHEFAPVKL